MQIKQIFSVTSVTLKHVVATPCQSQVMACMSCLYIYHYSRPQALAERTHVGEGSGENRQVHVIIGSANQIASLHVIVQLVT